MRGWIFSVACLAALGCGPTLGVRGRIAAMARTDMHCDQVRRVLQLNDYAFEVDGCGMMVEYGDSGVDAERNFHRITPAATIAAEETHCGIDRLQLIADPLPTRRSFAGCGSTVSYGLECSEGVGCHWARDGEVTRAVIVPASLPTAPTPAAPPTTTDVVPPPPGAS